jgi:hypothetical protein
MRLSMPLAEGRSDRARDARKRRWSVLAPSGVFLLLAAAAGCGGASVPAATTSAKPTSSSDRPARSLVGDWQRVTHCRDLVRALTEAGFEDHVLEAAAGNGFIPGVTSVEEIADRTHPCNGAVPRRHSHFFTSDGLFGSRDWNGNQVDEGSYELVGDHTLVMPYGFEEGPPIQVEFRYRINGNTLRFEPAVPSGCSTNHCREATAWSITVALPGKTWRRVG